MILREECIILNNKCDISIDKHNILGVVNIRLNSATKQLHKTIDTIESDAHMTHNFCYPWSKIVGIEFKFTTSDKDLIISLKWVIFPITHILSENFLLYPR